MSLSNYFEVEESSVQKILMFDLSNLIYRMLFISADEYKKRKSEIQFGETNVSFSKDDMYDYWKNMVLSNIIANIRERQPSRVIVAVDDKNNWRKGLYSEYKAHRKQAREDSIVDFDEFFPIMESFINELKQKFSTIMFIKVSNCEADDIIAILTKKHNGKDYIELISTDKDFVQLQIYKNFKQFNPITKEYVKSLDPKRDLQIKILTGDKSDNIPAVKLRCGPKTAEKMLNEGLVEVEQSEEIRSNYIRNTLLIDFAKIPEEIETKILNEYNNYSFKEIDGIGVGEWLECGGFKVLYSEWQSIYNTLTKLK